jgi:hypothetical protein
MRRTSSTLIAALILSLAAVPAVNHRLSAAELQLAQAAKPALEKLKEAQKKKEPQKKTEKEATLQFTLQPARVAKPAPDKTVTMDKIKSLGEHLARALDIAVDLFSGNEAEFLSKNRTALLSGNKPTILSGNAPNLLSGNAPNLLSGNAPKLLSGNATPIFSGNKAQILSGNSFSMFSNLKIEIHIENSGNNSPSIPKLPQAPASMQYSAPAAMPATQLERIPDPKEALTAPQQSIIPPAPK